MKKNEYKIFLLIFFWDFFSNTLMTLRAMPGAPRLHARATARATVAMATGWTATGTATLLLSILSFSAAAGAAPLRVANVRPVLVRDGRQRKNVLAAVAAARFERAAAAAAAFTFVVVVVVVVATGAFFFRFLSLF